MMSVLSSRTARSSGSSAITVRERPRSSRSSPASSPRPPGELFVNDIDVVKNPLALKENLGYLPEESRLYETMTAENYLAFFGEIYGLTPQEIRVRSTQLFAALSLEPDGKKIGEFSKGMKRKTAIARSLIHDPGIPCL